MPKIFKKGNNSVTTISPFYQGVLVAFVKYEGGFSVVPDDPQYKREWGYFVAVKDEEGNISGNIISRNSLMAKNAHATDSRQARPQFAGAVTAGIARKGLPFLTSIEGKWCKVADTYDIVRKCYIDGEATEKDCTVVALEESEGGITAKKLQALADDFKRQIESWGDF